MGLHFSNPAIGVSKLFCDKLSLTIDYKLKSEHKHIEGVVKSAGKLFFPYRRWPYRKGALVYQGEYPSKMAMTMQWEPMHCDVSYLRIDFNPTFADLEHLYALLSEVLPGGFSDIHDSAVITRFDAAIDITGILPHRLLAYYPKKSISKVECKSGVVETLYIGSPEASNRIVIYDKLLQLKQKKKKFNLSFSSVDVPITRLEIRMKPSLPLKALFEVENPFLPLILRPASLFLEEGSELWKLFIALTQTHGAQGPLMLLEKGTREIFKAKLEMAPCDWWQPEALWEEWPNLLFAVFKLESGVPLADAA